MNSFGIRFRITVFGESHGDCVGVVMDGIDPGIGLSTGDFMDDINRRRGGRTGTTPRTEEDIPQIISGLYKGYTTGAPLTIIFRNNNTRPADYGAAGHHRPSHADFTASEKYRGFNDPRGGGQFSGRMTLPLVAAGVVAKKTLGGQIGIHARIDEIGGCGEEAQYMKLVEEALLSGDSLGGVVSCSATGLPAGWGEPFFDSVESVISHLLFSIPAVKGVEFGSGFAGSRVKGSENNDIFISADGRTATNNSGGVNGGISNGNPMLLKVAVKPTPSISLTQNTFHFGLGEHTPLSIKGRHDACIALRMPVIVEAAVAVALCQFRPG